MPCIARWPGVIPENQTSAETTSTLDLFPTFARAAGVPPPTDRLYDGADILPLMRGQSAPAQRAFYYFNGRSLEAVREGKWKLRMAPGNSAGPQGPVSPELYDLDADPGEDYNQHARQPEIAARLKERLTTTAKELSAEIAT